MNESLEKLGQFAKLILEYRPKKKRKKKKKARATLKPSAKTGMQTGRYKGNG